MRRRIEIIVGGVRTLRLRATVSLVAPARRRLAAFGVNALNSGYFRERTAAGMTGNIEQQPWNVGGIRRVPAG
jgi:hypothetical protein